ncbi:hypothetical protein OG920_19545 [Streptomyces europaeiscabiei]|nr:MULTISPECIES: hypothetical protein [Streptomyces]MDX3587215.1 hypothetical protein [Streptomyces europaeiscabiei]MDX3613102.1 hypothetical protein [Streptomyces europaeiscabiei]MDX3634225.1 hypothetical protein [Streptomyces europaeiscabiei]MDX3651927.1 hypothetical protein [Streptomyces europaeiscabiei]WUD33435.1 hypothetical protein OG858_19740 [Streptomyces europaeiscabiei]
MNARRTWSLVVGTLLLAVVAVLFVYGGHAATILGRIGLRVF